MQRGDSIWGRGSGTGGQGPAGPREDTVTGLRANPRVRHGYLPPEAGGLPAGAVPGAGLWRCPTSGACRDEGGTHAKGTVLIPRAFRAPVLALRNSSITRWGRAGDSGAAVNHAEDICLSTHFPFFLVQVGLFWWNPAETARFTQSLEAMPSPSTGPRHALEGQVCPTSTDGQYLWMP